MLSLLYFLMINSGVVIKEIGSILPQVFCNFSKYHYTANSRSLSFFFYSYGKEFYFIMPVSFGHFPLIKLNASFNNLLCLVACLIVCNFV